MNRKLRNMNAMKTLSLILLSAFVLMACSSIPYISEQAKGQFSLLSKRKQVSEILQDENISKNLRDKLELSLYIRSFLEQELDLPMGDNYKSYVALEHPWVVQTLTVSEKCDVKAYEWKFPIVGSVPYLGFFNKDSAIKKEMEFKEKGYDTYLRGVSAYSTLGWFSDPILSTFVNFKTYYFIATLIHETVHANIFKKGDMTFNENIATFIEEEGTKRFIKKHFGEDSKELQDYIDSLKKSERQIQFLKDALTELREFYKSKTSCEEIQKTREKKFKEMEARFFKTFGYQHEINNAFLVHIALYNINIEDLREELKAAFKNDLKSFIQYYKAKYD